MDFFNMVITYQTRHVQQQAVGHIRRSRPLVIWDVLKHMSVIHERLKIGNEMVPCGRTSHFSTPFLHVAHFQNLIHSLQKP